MHWKCCMEKDEATPRSQRIIKTVRITNFSTSKIISPEGLTDLQKPEQSYDPYNLQVSEVKSKIAPQEPGHCSREGPMKSSYPKLIKCSTSENFLCSHHQLCLPLWKEIPLLHSALDCSRSLWSLKFASFFLAHEYKLEILWSHLLIWMDLQKTQAGSFA